jgi:hypothetical protein
MRAFLRTLIRRSGLALTRPARRTSRYLNQYYPPLYYRGYVEKLVGFEALLRSADEAHVDGDVVECGVGRGLTLYMLGHFMASRRSPRRLYGFDSFEGFPPPTAADASDRRPVAGDLWADTSLTHVVEHFRYGDLQEFFSRQVTLVPGFFSRTLPGAEDPKGIVLLNLDVDLYESYRDCLQFLGPRVHGAIVYDEYRAPKWPGATRAIDEALPGLGHHLYYAEAMARFVSMPAGQEGGAFFTLVQTRLGLARAT